VVPAGQAGSSLPAWRGWHQPDDGAPDHAADPDCHSLHLESGGGTGQALHGFLPAAGNRHAGCLPGAGPGLVLPLLGIHTHPDVLPDRCLGRRTAHLCGCQILPVHHGRLHFYDGWHSLPCECCWQLLPAGTGSQPGCLCRGGVVALPGVWAGVCHQGAHVPPAHLAARCPRGGSHCRVGHPGGSPAENGCLRLHPL